MSGFLMQEDRRRKLIASARLLESDQAGERQAAFDAVMRLLPAGVTVADVFEQALPVARPVFVQPVDTRPKPTAPLRRWQHKALTISLLPKHLNERERSCIADMTVRTSEPSEKQSGWLNNLYARIEAREAA